MGLISSVFNTIFYEPLLNGLVWLINILPGHDIGFAVIILTVIVRLITFPLNHRAVVIQEKIRQLEPQIKEIKEKFKDNAQEQAKRTMDLYKTHGINPFFGIFNLLVQIPIIIALYRVFLNGVNFGALNLYSFIPPPESVNINFLGLIDMTKKNYILAFLAGLSQFFQMRIAMPPQSSPKSKGKTSFKDEFIKSMNFQAKYIMPILIFFIALQFSSAVSLYWTTMNIFAIIQEIIVKRKKWTNKLK